jgi:glycosyltransferase involved in cell wall biosynthesis
MEELQSPLVTIAIPTYNRADGFLKEALQSALQQTYTPLEILVADNCSTDATPELMARYTDDARVRYVRHETNLGPYKNFNFCVEAAQGRFFLMLHDDDRIDPDFVETCMAAVDGPEHVGYIRTGVRLIDKSGDVVERHPNEAEGTRGAEAILRWIRCQNFWTLSSTLYETEALRAVGGFSDDEFPLTCDCYATARIALEEGGGVELRPIKASFRVHDEEITHGVSARRWIDEWGRFHKRLIELAPSPEIRKQFRKEGAEFFSMLAYNYAEDVPSPLSRYAAYALTYSKFRGRYLPPPIRKSLRTFKHKISLF